MTAQSGYFSPSLHGRAVHGAGVHFMLSEPEQRGAGDATGKYVHAVLYDVSGGNTTSANNLDTKARQKDVEHSGDGGS